MEQNIPPPLETTDSPAEDKALSPEAGRQAGENETMAPPFGQQELRDLAWRIGSYFPQSFHREGISFLPVTPNQGFIQWNVTNETVTRLMAVHGSAWHGARPVLRIYDVTDIEFNGFNAHRCDDVGIGSLTGNYYLKIHHHERDLLVEMGFCLTGGQFVSCVRSAPLRFSRPGRSRRRSTAGLYVGRGFDRVFPVENILHAPVFAPLSAALRAAGDAPMSAAVFLAERAAMGARSQLFIPFGEECRMAGDLEISERPDVIAAGMSRRFNDAHDKHPFTCIQCHEWYSAPPALSAASRFGLPIVSVLRSTEAERCGGKCDSLLSKRIARRECDLVAASAFVLVPAESTRRSVLHEYAVPPERVAVVPEPQDGAKTGGETIRETRRYYNMGEGPLALFAGEIAHHTGADLLLEAIVNVSKDFPQTHFFFAGDGYLKEELSQRAWGAGIGERCHFSGDVPSEAFGRILAASDFIALPARAPQDGGLAVRALAEGKPVLTTHQSGLAAVRHGVNGVVCYDNPGSVTWGLREMLGSPPPMIGAVAGGTGDHHAPQRVAALYMTYWAEAIHRRSLTKE
jgi:glycosyltransferase involved in cell wall biosynthesis